VVSKRERAPRSPFVPPPRKIASALVSSGPAPLAPWKQVERPAMSERFYMATPLGLGPLTLDGPEAHHLATVCRLRPGATVCLFNGDGHQYEAHVRATARRQVELEVTKRHSPARELPFVLRVAAPVPKGDRAQF